MNKKINNDEGVSPVIAVILMVAITVVLAAVVYVLVSHLGNNTPTNNNHLSLSEQGHTTTTYSFTVLSVDQNTNYADISVKVNGGAGTYTHTGNSLQVAAGDIITVGSLQANTQYDISFVYQNNILVTMTVHT